MEESLCCSGQRQLSPANEKSPLKSKRREQLFYTDQGICKDAL